MKASSFWWSLATMKPRQAGEAYLSLVITTASYIQPAQIFARTVCTQNSQTVQALHT